MAAYYAFGVNFEAGGFRDASYGEGLLDLDVRCDFGADGNEERGVVEDVEDLPVDYQGGVDDKGPCGLGVCQLLRINDVSDQLTASSPRSRTANPLSVRHVSRVMELCKSCTYFCKFHSLLG